ncbi:DNA polymerase III, gamma/tau subunits [Mycoavidus cysteinexigens]|uniref:DNA polymerase III, gamma/tau subunits n=2 Tax=Mycoavidus cysteinexigens TaxID=1553431 RepID=A0A2Z6EVJ3_9BURK|nr:DNA polymerase III subunit gamma/tau C-terminal domain-containing protein [Mycoavidus cysteinexigens]BBE09115.1 DNA polymerase III, gamma/tau subunits [Mycoavidus cysteinexigens]GAM52145.1 DNA polymerase III subunits gamma and tau [bacterium endosymbiont of Mortierella elongata FMR23-6]
MPEHEDAAQTDSLAALGCEHDWPALVTRLPLRGLVKELAYRSELVRIEGTKLTLKVSVAQLAERGQLDKLCAALTEYLGKPLKLVAEIGSVTQTAAALDAAHNLQRQQAAEQALAQDSFAQTLMRDFDATIVPGSVKPTPSTNTPNI